MKKRSLLILILIPVTLLVMTGCTRSATRAPRTTPDEGVFPSLNPPNHRSSRISWQPHKLPKPQELSASTKEPTDVPATGRR